MTTGRSSIPRGLVVVLVLLQVALGVVLGQIWVSSHHTLYNNGNWTPTKTTLHSGIMGAYAFLFGRQTLSRGNLNLGAWHGHQEVVLDREVEPVSIAFDYFLTNHSYLVIELDRFADIYTGIRLSRNKMFEPAILKTNQEGKHVRKRARGALKRASRGHWRRLEIRLNEDGGVLRLGGEQLMKVDALPHGPQRLAFRAGRYGVLIDNVEVVSKDGQVFTDGFDRPTSWLRVLSLCAASVVLISWLLFWLLGRATRVEPKFLSFYFLMFTALLLVLGVIVYFFSSYQKQFYPNAGERMRQVEAAWAGANAEATFEQISQTYAPRPGPGVHRIVFVGSSQTRGSGALEEDEVLVRQTERLLNARSGAGEFECINGAVRGYRIPDMANDFIGRWIGFAPRTAIVNAGNNDIGKPERFSKQLSRMVRVGQEAGIRMVLVMEPNSLERTSTLPRIHEIMAEVGEAYDVPVIDMQSHLAAKHDDGFLWWDWVHLSSYGQRLFAEHLVEQLDELGLI